jgi:hypothetical protein
VYRRKFSAVLNPITAGARQVSKRWSSHVAEDIPPLGSETCAEEAVEILWNTGPPEMIETLEGERVKPSKELARKYVVELAKKFRHDSFLIKDAPRVGSDVREIRRIQSLAKALGDALRDSNDDTRIALQMGAFNPFGLPVSPIVEQCDAAGLPLPGRAGADGNPRRWERRLLALDLYLGHCIGICSQKVDRGGNTNVYKSEWGSPRSALVTSGWYVFQIFRPGEATASENGAFHRFVDCIFEYATDREATAHAKLASHLKLSVPLRESRLEIATIKRLNLERESTGTSPARKAKIRRELYRITCKAFP